LIYKYVYQYIKYRSEEYQIDDEIKKAFFDSKQLTFKPSTRKFKIALKGNNLKKVYIDTNDGDYISSLPNDYNNDIKNNSSGGDRNMAHFKMIYGGMNNSSIIIIDDSKIDDINHVDESSSGIDSSSLYNETSDRKKQRNRKRKNNNKHRYHHYHHRNMIEEDSISITNTDINLDVDDSLFSSQSMLMNDNDGDDHALPSSSPLFAMSNELRGNQQLVSERNEISNNAHHHFKQQLLSSPSNNSDDSMIYDGKDVNISIINTTSNTDNNNTNLNGSSSITTRNDANNKKNNDDSKNNDDYDSKIKKDEDYLKSHPTIHRSPPHQLHQLLSLHSPSPSPEHSPQNFGRIGKYSRRRHNKDHQHHVNILGPGKRKSIDMLQQQSYFDDSIRDHRENYTDLLVLPTNIELPMVDILNPNASLLKNKIYNNYDYDYNDKNDYKNIYYSQLSNSNSMVSLSFISPTSYDIFSSSTYDNHYSTPSQDHINLSNSSIRNNSQSNFYHTSNNNNNKSNHNDDSMTTNNNNALVTPMNKQQLHEVGKSSLHSKNRHRYRSRSKKEFHMDG